MPSNYAKTSKPTVLHLVPRLHNGGAEQVLLRYLAHELSYADAGETRDTHEVVSYDVDWDSRTVRHFNDLSIKIHTPPAIGLIGIKAFTLLGVVLKQIVRCQSSIVIIAYSPSIAVPSFILGKAFGRVSCVLYLHSLPQHLIPGALSRLKRLAYLPMLCILGRLTDKNIFVSRKQRMLFSPILRIEKEKWLDLPNPFEFRQDPAERERRHPGHLDQNVKYAFLGRLSPEKKVEDVIHLFASVLKKDPSATLLIGGDGPERRKLERLAAGLGITSRVTFGGDIQDKQAFFGSFDVFLFPSKYESFGLVILEAANAGKLVVCKNTALTRRIARATPNVRPINTFSAAELRKAVANVESARRSVEKDAGFIDQATYNIRLTTFIFAPPS